MSVVVIYQESILFYACKFHKNNNTNWGITALANDNTIKSIGVLKWTNVITRT